MKQDCGTYLSSKTQGTDRRTRQAETGAKKKIFQFFRAHFCWYLFRCTSHKMKGCMLLEKLNNNKEMTVGIFK